MLCHIDQTISSPLTGAVRFGPLGPTPFLDGRCTFLDVSRLGSGLSRRMFPEFTRFVLTAYAERTPFLLNVRDIFFLTNLVVCSICSHFGYILLILELSAIAPSVTSEHQRYPLGHQRGLRLTVDAFGHHVDAGHGCRRHSLVPSLSSVLFGCLLLS